MVFACLSTLLSYTHRAISMPSQPTLSSIPQEADKGLESGESTLVAISIIIIFIMCFGVFCCICMNLILLPDDCEIPRCTCSRAKINSVLTTCLMFLTAAPLLWSWVLIPLYHYIGQPLTNLLGYYLSAASFFLAITGIVFADGVFLGIALLFFFLCAGLLGVKKPLEGSAMNRILPTLYLILMIILFSIATSTLYTAPEKENSSIIMFLVLGVYLGITTLVLVWREIPSSDGDHYATAPA